MPRPFYFFFILFSFLPFVVQGVFSIDINTASSEELDEITGIGPVLAQRIIEARPFNSLDDLTKVKGIGEKTLQKIKDQGLARVGYQEKSDPGTAASEENNPPAVKTEQEQKQKKETKPLTYPTGIVFSEILPSPEGPDEENEWIELYNQNRFEVDLSGWIIKDAQGKTKTYPLKSKIPANGYLIIPRTETNITLNNDGDGLNLSNPNGEIVDSVTFGKASLGQSYNLTSSGWTWSTFLTPGAENILPQKESSKAPGGKEKPEDGHPEYNSIAEKGTAAISATVESSWLSTLLIAFSVAIFSGIAALIVKN